MIRMQVVVPEIPKCSKMTWRSMAHRFRTAKAEWCKSRGERRDFYQVRHPRKRRRTQRTLIFPTAQPDWYAQSETVAKHFVTKNFLKIWRTTEFAPSLFLLSQTICYGNIGGEKTKTCRKFMQLVQNQHCSGFFQGPRDPPATRANPEIRRQLTRRASSGAKVPRAAEHREGERERAGRVVMSRGVCGPGIFVSFP